MSESFTIDAPRTRSLTRGSWADGNGRVYHNQALWHRVRVAFAGQRETHWAFHFSLRRDADACAEGLGRVFGDVARDAVVTCLGDSELPDVRVHFVGTEWDYSDVWEQGNYGRIDQ